MSTYSLSLEAGTFEFEANSIGLKVAASPAAKVKPKILDQFPATPQTVPGGKYYITQQGDRWDMISFRVYGMQLGADHHADTLIESNPALRQFSELPGGMSVLVPDLPEPDDIPLVPWRRTSEEESTPMSDTNNFVSTRLKYANPAWLTSLPYSKLTGAPTRLSSFSNDVGYITNAALALYAPLSSPSLTGAPTAPTASNATNGTQIATTAFAHNLITDLVNMAPGTLDTLGEIAAALQGDEDSLGALITTVGGKQPLDANLTAISALTTTTFGRSLLTPADAAAARAILGAGTSSFSGAFTDLTGKPTSLTPIIDTVANRGLANDIYVSSRTTGTGTGEASDPFPYSALATVITNAAAGSTIYFVNGTYANFNFTVSKSLTFKGSRAAIFSPNSADDAMITVSGTTTEFRLEGVSLVRAPVYHAVASVAAAAAIYCPNMIKSLTVRDIYSSSFYNTIEMLDDTHKASDTLDVQDSTFVSPYGKGGSVGLSPYTHPCVAILGAGGIKTIIKNNIFNGLVDPTFTGVSGSPPSTETTPMDGIFYTGSATSLDMVVEGNFVKNFGIEGIQLLRTSPAGTYRARISGNILVGPEYVNPTNQFFTTNPGIQTTDIRGLIVSDNTISNAPKAIGVSYTTADDLNLATVTGNTIKNCVVGIKFDQTSTRAVASDNSIHLSSEPVRTNQGNALVPSELFGVQLTSGKVIDNSIIAEEPSWDLTTTLTSRASNVFTLASVTGITTAGALVSYQGGLVSWFPVTGVAGSDVTVDAGWASAAPGVTSGAIYYQASRANLPNSGAITQIGSSGTDTVTAINNFIQGALFDSYHATAQGTFIAAGMTLRSVHAIRPVITGYTKAGSWIVDGAYTLYGASSRPAISKSGTYTVLATDGDIEANAGIGAFTLTNHALSAALAGLVRTYTNVGTSNNVTLTVPTGTVTIVPGQSITLKVNKTGTNWIEIADVTHSVL